MKIGDIPDSLPPHPEEARLRDGEKQLADTLEELVGKITTALRADEVDRTRHRIDAAVGLQLLKDTADSGRAAMARAIQDQMDIASGK